MQRQIKSDRRTRQTGKFIRDAFLQLIAEKGYPAITIQDITDRAEMNRSTFYYHYKGKEELLEQCIHEMLSLAEKDIMRPAGTNDQETNSTECNDQIRFYIRLFEHISGQADFYRVMLRHVPLCGQRLSGIIQQFYQARIFSNHPIADNLVISRELLTTYITGAYTAVILSWLEQGLPYTPASMAQQLSLVMNKGPYRAAGLLQ
ncbi:TetR/AcrR family transcriptional regulator [Paenibacillus roseus]|uniref:TetR/AcrR family transcriptional regulator n=1 Tax=Paenibacillus roseus TaxID=2798579 RepID=A0A934J3W2_9BACL|nr:TetR/AcrR family transcriptional regulator [Paenibacillus roseus]